MRNVIIVVLIILAAVFVFSRESEEVTLNDSIIGGELQGSAGDVFIKENGGYKTIDQTALNSGGNLFKFSITIIDSWDTQLVQRGQAINVYNPAMVEGSSLDSSQIFIDSFVANNFQVAEDINILSRQEHEIVGLPAVTYVISKNGNEKVFVGEPTWRDEIHKITEVRISEENPSRFYVFAKNPNLSEAEFKRFLDSLEF